MRKEDHKKRKCPLIPAKKAISQNYFLRWNNGKQTFSWNLFSIVSSTTHEKHNQPHDEADH